MSILMLIREFEMKKILFLLCFYVIISGCSSLSQSTKPSIDGLSVAGSLNCKSNEICPIVLVEWDKKQNHKLSLETVLISSYNYYDIKSITFLVDDKAFSYKPTGLTQQKSINQLIPRHSLNSFILPRSFLEEINEAKNIEISIETDKGNIKRSVYSETQKSMLYLNFIKLDATNFKK